jgi:surface carbohydrate biosynthesis protein
LDGKLWLALHLLTEGHDVCLGHHPVMRNWIDELEPDIYVTVSAAGVPEKRNRLAALQDIDVTVIVLDTEGGIFYSDNDYLKRISPAILDHVDKFLAWGQRPGEIVHEATSFPEAQIHATGNPKFDLLHETGRDFYRRDAEALRDQYGPYILLATNFGLVNHYDDDMQRRLLSRDDILRMRDSSDRLQFKPFQRDLLDGFLQAIPDLHDALNGVTIVARPHPSEDHDTYRDEWGDLKNVVIEHSGSIYPWLLGSRALIHNNSTTAVEAVLLERPAIAFEPVRNNEYTAILPNYLSDTATTAEELITSIKTAIETGERPRSTLDDRQIETLKSYISNVDGEGGVRAANMMGKAGTANWDSASPFPLSKRQGIKRALDRYGGKPYRTVRATLHSLLHQSDTTGYIKQKFGGLEVSELRDRVERMRSLDDRLAELEYTISPASGLQNCHWLERVE